VSGVTGEASIALRKKKSIYIYDFKLTAKFEGRFTAADGSEHDKVKGEAVIEVTQDDVDDFQWRLSFSSPKDKELEIKKLVRKVIFKQLTPRFEEFGEVWDC
jgi:activator of HSP90 ATPase